LKYFVNLKLEGISNLFFPLLFFFGGSGIWGDIPDTQHNFSRMPTEVSRTENSGNLKGMKKDEKKKIKLYGKYFTGIC
jgi:hypothetical protein